jgi:hypothetical protein
VRAFLRHESGRVGLLPICVRVDIFERGDGRQHRMHTEPARQRTKRARPPGRPDRRRGDASGPQAIRPCDSVSLLDAGEALVELGQLRIGFRSRQRPIQRRAVQLVVEIRDVPLNGGIGHALSHAMRTDRVGKDAIGRSFGGLNVIALRLVRL